MQAGRQTDYIRRKEADNEDEIVNGRTNGQTDDKRKTKSNRAYVLS